MLSLFASVISIYNKMWAAILWLITGLIAYARVYVGVHHFIDVLASMLIVIIVTFISFQMLKKSLLDTITHRINRILQRFGWGYGVMEI